MGRKYGSFWLFCGAAVLVLPAPIYLSADTSPLGRLCALVCFLSQLANVHRRIHRGNSKFWANDGYTETIHSDV
jgi:hypothetical protein